ncbi:hypothetical protein Tco_1123976 [Tanacetum coccineum]|uniref:DUF4283 domain-containing protein n=1 Tax=Tanacetum coccineum TaxID=301880 RepID=A0ABQ5J5F9_9ASTR
MFTTLGRRDKTKKQNVNYTCNCNKPSANGTEAGGPAVMVVADSSGGPAVWCPIMVSDIGGDEEQLGQQNKNMDVDILGEMMSLISSSVSQPTKCSNCKVKDLRINMLVTRIKMLEARLECERHPEDHACGIEFVVLIASYKCTGLVNEYGCGGNGDGNDGDHSSGNGGILKPTTNVAATATVSPTVPTSSTPTSYAKLFTGDKSKKSVNFRTLITPAENGVDVVVPVESIKSISERFANTTYGFFLGKRVAYPVVANYVRNTWGKYDMVKSMLNSSTGLFSFQFSSMNGLDAMLENVWLKLHGVSVMAFNEDGLSAIATKIGRSSSARAMIKLRADVELKDTVVVAMPKIIGEGFYTCNIRVEYEWKPPRSSQVVFLPPQKLFAYVTGGDVNPFGVWIRQHAQGLKELDEMKNETKRFA